MHWVLVFSFVLAGDPAPGPERVTRSYNIRFLTRSVPQFPAEIWPEAGGLVLERWADEDVGAIEFSDEEEEEEAGEMAPPGRGIPAATLVALVRQNIAEDSWANKRNSIEAAGGELVVTQSPDVHQAIVRFLESLRARRARMVTVDVAVVPASSLGEYVDLERPWFADAALEEVVERAGEKGHRLSVTAYNEQTVSGFTGRLSSRLVDSEVNQTGVVPVSNPVVLRLPLGLSVEALPLALAGTDWFRLDLKVTRLEPTGDACRRETFFGDLEFASLREESLETVLLVPQRRTALAGTFTAEATPGKKSEFAVLARVRPFDLVDEKKERADSEETFHLRVYDIGFLGAYPEEHPLLEPDLLVDLISASVEPEAWRDERTSLSLEGDGRFLHITARAATHQSVRAFLKKLLRDRARVATLEIEEFEAPLDVLLELRRQAGAGWELGADWRREGPGRKLRPVLRAAVAGALGTRMVAQGYESRDFVADIETVSGGTGFSVTEMADPVVVSAGTGFQLTASVASLHRPDHLAMDAKLDRCRTRFEKTAEVLAATEIGPAELPPRASREKKDDSPEPERQTVWLPFVLDLPDQRQLPCRASLALRPGRPAILKVEATGDGLGRLVVATVRVAAAFEEGR